MDFKFSITILYNIDIGDKIIFIRNLTIYFIVTCIWIGYIIKKTFLGVEHR